jgi:hypothetical protein
MTLASAEKARPATAHLRITNPESGDVVQDLGLTDTGCCRVAGSAVIPMAVEVAIGNLPQGPYRPSSTGIECFRRKHAMASGTVYGQMSTAIKRVRE